MIHSVLGKSSAKARHALLSPRTAEPRRPAMADSAAEEAAMVAATEAAEARAAAAAAAASATTAGGGAPVQTTMDVALLDTAVRR